MVPVVALSPGTQRDAPSCGAGFAGGSLSSEGQDRTGREQRDKGTKALLLPQGPSRNPKAAAIGSPSTLSAPPALSILCWELLCSPSPFGNRPRPSWVALPCVPADPRAPFGPPYTTGDTAEKGWQPRPFTPAEGERRRFTDGVQHGFHFTPRCWGARGRLVSGCHLLYPQGRVMLHKTPFSLRGSHTRESTVGSPRGSVPFSI